jgi:hypothetical protein
MNILSDLRTRIPERVFWKNLARSSGSVYSSSMDACYSLGLLTPQLRDLLLRTPQHARGRRGDRTDPVRRRIRNKRCSDRLPRNGAGMAAHIPIQAIFDYW